MSFIKAVIKHTTLRRRVMLGAAFLGLTACYSTPSAQNSQMVVSPTRLQQIDNVIQQYVDKQQLAGAVALIKHQGKTVYQKAFGWQNIEANITMSNDSIFRIASQTKAIVSVAIMQMQERGQLLIQDPVSRYLPEYQQTFVAQQSENGEYHVVNAKRQITIRDLLTHTSGIGYGHGLAKQQWQDAGIQGWYFSGVKKDMRSIVKEIAKLPQDNHPGTEFTYGYSTDILGAIIETITGRTLDAYLQQNIFKPLQMNDTHFYLPAEKQHKLSVVYHTSKSGELQALPAGKVEQSQGQYHAQGDIYSGGAGLVSTAADYGNFLQMMLNGGHFNEYTILTPMSVKLMTESHLSEDWLPGLGFGLGFAVVTDTGLRGMLGSKGEYGWGGAYHSTYWVDPENELVVVYLSQLLPANGLDDHDKFRAAVYQSLVENTSKGTVH